MHDFDVLELYQLAERLIATRPVDEATRRTAANRYYYAAFLVARRKANLDSLKEKSHTVVREYWKARNLALFRRLSSLYAYREHADYTRDLNFTETNLDDSQRTSQFILRKLGMIP